MTSSDVERVTLRIPPDLWADALAAGRRYDWDVMRRRGREQPQASSLINLALERFVAHVNGEPLPTPPLKIERAPRALDLRATDRSPAKDPDDPFPDPELLVSRRVVLLTEQKWRY